MEPAVEIYSRTDPPHVQNRQVWYWAQFPGFRSPDSTEYAPIRALVEETCRVEDRCYIDRSDAGSGYLRSTLS